MEGADSVEIDEHKGAPTHTKASMASDLAVLDLSRREMSVLGISLRSAAVLFPCLVLRGRFNVGAGKLTVRAISI